MKGFTRRRSLGVCAAAGFALVTLAAAVPTARADAIDNALMEKGRDIIQYLRDKKVKNVGVLKFQVQVRGEKPSMEVGRLNSLMETRLENVLILANEDDDNIIGITRGASQAAAARDKKASYLTPEGRAELFKQKYPLAWGKEQVKVDRFLTGVVETSPDLKKTTVTVHAYAPGDAKPQEVTHFTVTTDRLLLADMNQGYFLRKRELSPTLEYDQGDVAAVLNAGGGGDKIRPDPKKDDPKDTFDNVLQFDVLYNGKKAQRDAKGGIRAPQKGDEVQFTLKASERIGVVLLVNGMNTLNEEDDERPVDQYSMWVLEPGKEYTIKGYYTREKGKGDNGTDFKRIKVLSESESVLAELANESKRGKIELYLFRETSGKALQGKTLPPNNLRTESGRAETLPGIRAQVGREVVRARGIMVPNPVAERGPDISQVPFNGVPAGARAITYYHTPR